MQFYFLQNCFFADKNIDKLSEKMNETTVEKKNKIVISALNEHATMQNQFQQNLAAINMLSRQPRVPLIAPGLHTLAPSKFLINKSTKNHFNSYFIESF